MYITHFLHHLQLTMSYYHWGQVRQVQSYGSFVLEGLVVCIYSDYNIPSSLSLHESSLLPIPHFISEHKPFHPYLLTENRKL
jgi:hypothetical protein